MQMLTPGFGLRMWTSGQLGGDQTPAVLVVAEAVVGPLPLHVGSGDMSSFEQGSVCPSGPTIEWLEPKLPDALKNGGTLASITKDSTKMQGTAVEPAEMDSCDIVGVIKALNFIPFLTFCYFQLFIFSYSILFLATANNVSSNTSMCVCYMI